MATEVPNLVRGRIYDDITQTIGNTPSDPSATSHEGLSGRGRGEAGEFQPALVGERSDRRGDDRRGRGRGADHQGYRDHRADQRQYGDCARLHLRCARISSDRDDAREHEPGASPSDQGIWSRDRLDACGGGDARSRPQGRRAGQEHAQCVHAPAIQEPGQPRDPSPHNGRGNLARHRRPDRHPGQRSGDRRHDHRLRRGP